MQERVTGPLAALAENIRISTLHAEALRLLHGLHGAPRFFVSDIEARLLMQDAIEDSGFANLAKVRSCQDWVRLRKAEHLRPGTGHSHRLQLSNDEERLQSIRRTPDVQSFRRPRQYRWKGRGASATVPGADNPASYIKYLLIDEYQDINECDTTHSFTRSFLLPKFSLWEMMIKVLWMERGQSFHH